MKFRTAAFAVAALIASTVAQAGIVATPNPVSFTGQGGLVYFKTVTVTNQGPGFASNLDANLNWVSGSTGDISPISDTCTGATLAVGGTCALRFMFDAGCPKAGWKNYSLVITSSSVPTLTVPVNSTTKAGICY